MKLSTLLHENYVLIELKEEQLNSLIAPDLKSQFVLFNTEGRNNVILDLTEVNYADSSGLSALLTARRMFEGAGGVFIICGVSEHIAKLIKLSNLDSVLTVVPSKKEAIEHIFMHHISEEDEEGDNLEGEIMSEFDSLNQFEESGAGEE